jgi:TonB-linked SusC/RagA family outer membrane protein
MQNPLLEQSRGFSGRMLYLLIIMASFIATGPVWAQTSVSGKVKSGDDNAPMPGVNIVIKGTSTGTITDVNGNFTINTSSSNDALLFSFVGFVTQEVAVNGRSSLDITLMTDATQLTEVVVTALGIEKDVAKLGYTVQKVQGSDLIKAREPNALNSLVGKVAGLTIGISSELLGRPQIVLRGETNILIVVDGVPVVSDSWNISPDDIETYTVLKGPNAAALYGSRGQNGAILITTKRGTKDKRGFSVEFNSSTMVDKGFISIPKVQDEYGPGEYNTYKFGDDPFGQINGYNQNDYDVWGPKFNGQLISQYDSPVDPVTGVRQGTPWTARGKDNLKRFVQAGILATNNIAISAGNDKYDIRASLSQSYQRGIVPNSQLNISNFNITSGYNVSSKFRIESNLNYNKQYTDNFPDVNYGPNSMIYNIDIWAGADWDIDDLKNYWQPGKVGIQQRSFEYYRYNNPHFLANEWLRGHQKTDVYGYLTFKYTITDWLKASLRSQISTWDLVRNEKFPFSAGTYGREQKQGDYREDRRNLFENNTDFMLSLDKKFANNFSVSGLVGANLRTYSYNSSYATTDYLNVPGVYNFANSKNPVKVYNYTAPMQVASAYYSFDFSFKNYVTLSTTGRLDKYSTFTKGYNTGFYPSVALSTVINDYIELPNAISFLKLRGSYANVKNAFTASTIGPAWSSINAGNPIDYGSTYQSAYDGPLYNSNTYSISKPYNNIGAAYYTQVLSSPTLKPSANSSIEAGLDVKFLENRLGLDFTVFNATRGPGIVTQQYSEASGFQGGTINGVKTEKKGFELAISGTPIQSEKFSWMVATNWSHYVETFKEFYNGLTSLNGSYLGLDNRIAYKIGDRVDNFYGYNFYRSPDGQIIHDGSGMILRDNRVAQKLGHSNPNYVWSVINTFKYKNLSINFQFDGRIGGVGVDYIYKKLMQGGRAIETVQGDIGKARLAEFNANPNNDPSIYTPVLTGSGVQIASGTPVFENGQITNMSELTFKPNASVQYLQDYIGRMVGFDEPVLINKSYAKLRQVMITYNLPSAFLQRMGIRQTSVSLVGRNLLYFAKRKDLDLDSFIGTSTSSQILQSPTLRRYGINLNLVF